MKKFIIKIFVVISALTMLIMPSAGCGTTKNLASGTTWEITETTKLDRLTIADEATIKAPEGYSLTMTVDGIETPINPGTYKGDIVITKAQANIVDYSHANMTHYFRQALYLDDTGLVMDKSVLPAAGSYALNNGTLTGVKITSVGENFNGIYVSGGYYTIKGATIDFTGNGGNDFAGYGAAVMGTGKNTTLVMDGANINTHGAIRTAVAADGGANVIVKNSNIQSRNGVLPKDYVPNTDAGKMKEVPWMLGLVGNCRATNLLGDNTSATYIKSDIASEGWGVLSTDACQNVKLTAINSKIAITGKSGYGAFAINNALLSFYGCDFNVGDYAVIITRGDAIFGASTPETVSKLNNNLKLGLTGSELSSLNKKQTTINSGRFGVMLRGKGSVKVMDDTVFNCGKTIFLVKGCSADINVDGSKGAQLNPKNGVIIQMMDDDDTFDPLVAYTEPTKVPVKAKDFDVTASNNSDVIATFSNIALKGDFYNAITGPGGMPGGGAGGPGGMPSGDAGGPGGMPSGGAGGPGGMPSGDAGDLGGMPGAASGKNLVLTFNNASIIGVVSSTTAKHAKDTITSLDYLLVGEVTNTPSAAINNGVIVSLAKSTWTVTGTSYLTVLTIGEGSAVKAPKGYNVTMTIDGTKKQINAGTYKGNIMLTVTKS